MKQLVNHGGVIQYKWIIKNIQELQDYIFTIGVNVISKRTRQWIYSPENDKQIDQLYHIHQVGILQLNAKLIAELWENCQKYILKENTLVFNETGGYCSWNDTMKLLDWEFLLECKDVVVLENASIVDENVKNYCKDLDYLALTNLNSFTLEEIFYYCSKASTIVFQTQAVDKEQINKLLTLAEKLSPKEIVVINSERFPTHDKRLEKHNIKIVEIE